jgi:hypothetical protein
MTKIVEIWSCSCNIPKSSRKWLQVACSHKWTGYILADFYYCYNVYEYLIKGVMPKIFTTSQR